MNIVIYNITILLNLVEMSLTHDLYDILANHYGDWSVKQALYNSIFNDDYINYNTDSVKEITEIFNTNSVIMSYDDKDIENMIKSLNNLEEFNNVTKMFGSAKTAKLCNAFNKKMRHILNHSYYGVSDIRYDMPNIELLSSNLEYMYAMYGHNKLIRLLKTDFPINGFNSDNLIIINEIINQIDYNPNISYMVKIYSPNTNTLQYYTEIINDQLIPVSEQHIFDFEQHHNKT